VSPKIKGLRERNKEDKLARIERAARYLFSRHGYDETTTRKIATRAGIGIGTLFVYFPEKRDVLLHLFRTEILDVKNAAFDNLPDGLLVDRLMVAFGRFYDHFEKDKPMWRVFIKEVGFVSDRQRETQQRFTFELTNTLAAIVGQAQAKGEVDASVQPIRVAFPIMAFYQWSLIGWLGSMVPDRQAALALLRSNLEFLYRGLVAR